MYKYISYKHLVVIVLLLMSSAFSISSFSYQYGVCCKTKYGKLFVAGVHSMKEFKNPGKVCAAVSYGATANMWCKFNNSDDYDGQFAKCCNTWATGSNPEWYTFGSVSELKAHTCSQYGFTDSSACQATHNDF